MEFKSILKAFCARTTVVLAAACFAQCISAQVTFAPYLQPGDNGPFDSADQMVIAWQTNETTPAGGYQVSFGKSTKYGSIVAPSARVVDNYLAADPSLPISPYSYGAHSNYTAVPQRP